MAERKTIYLCLPAGPYVTDEDVRYIVESIKVDMLVNRSDKFSHFVEIYQLKLTSQELVEVK